MFSSAYKVVLCLMRRFVSHDDRVNAPVAGFVSALSVSFETNSRKSLFTILVLSRCIDSLLNYMQDVDFLSNNRSLRYFLLFVISSTFLVSLRVVRPELVNTGLQKFFTHWSMCNYND